MPNKEKCNAWIDMLLAIIKMSKELTDEEYEYIEANFLIKLGEIKLKEMENKYGTLEH